MKKIIAIIFFAGICINGISQKQTPKEYIKKWKSAAITQMELHKIPASITLAQGILESGSGNSDLATIANNHFGIKCHSTWKGKTFTKDDDKKDECFRKYTNAFESFEDHSKFLAHRGRYSSLFTLETTDYEGWAKGLRKAGYATNPKYANLLIDLIESNGLYQYDRMEAAVAENEPGHKIELPQNKLVIPKVGAVKHSIQFYFKTKYVLAKKGDTYYKVSKEFDMSLWQLYNYNDCGEETKLMVGERIYLQPKRNKVKTKFHTVIKGETLRSIAQQEGVKLKKIYKKNELTVDSKITIGQKIKLK